MRVNFSRSPLSQQLTLDFIGVAILADTQVGTGGGAASTLLTLDSPVDSPTGLYFSFTTKLSICSR